MRWARYDNKGVAAYGVVEGDRLIPVRGSPFGAWERTSERRDLADVTLLVPVVPPTFYAAGLNYAEHVKEAAEKMGLPVNLPTQPDIGYRANNALIGHKAAIVIPPDATEQVQYEGELVAVIGRECKNLTRENALSAVMGWTIGNDVSERSWQKQDKHLTEENAFSCVFGYTIGNDVSERTWQRGDRTFWRGKNTDTFKPMGPWIETDVDLESLVTTIRLNGRELIRFDTNHMVFGVVDYLVAMTSCLTLYPGDVVWMGTEGHTDNMKHGDTIEIEISQIGVLSNPVIREGQ